MTKFTKGPWRLARAASSFILIDDDSSPSKIVARAHHIDIPQNEVSANARLIAAAPAMFEALKFVLAGYKYEIDHGAKPTPMAYEIANKILAALELAGDNDETK